MAWAAERAAVAARELVEPQALVQVEAEVCGETPAERLAAEEVREQAREPAECPAVEEVREQARELAAGRELEAQAEEGLGLEADPAAGDREAGDRGVEADMAELKAELQPRGMAERMLDPEEALPLLAELVEAGRQREADRALRQVVVPLEQLAGQAAAGARRGRRGGGLPLRRCCMPIRLARTAMKAFELRKKMFARC